MFLYLMSGNEFFKDSIYDGPADFYLNTSPVTQGSGLVGLVNTRQVGEFVGTEAMLHDLFLSFGDASSAATAYTAADNVLANQVYPQLQVSGFGNSPIGTSPVRGMHWGRNESPDSCPGAGFPSYSRVSKAFMHGIYTDGLWQYLASRGPIGRDIQSCSTQLTARPTGPCKRLSQQSMGLPCSRDSLTASASTMLRR